MKIRPVGVELYHADWRTCGYDEAKSCVSQFCKRPLKKASRNDVNNSLYLYCKLRQCLGV